MMAEYHFPVPWNGLTSHLSRPAGEDGRGCPLKRDRVRASPSVTTGDRT